MTPLEQQFEELKAAYGTAELLRLASGEAVITISGFPLPPGWSASATTLRFVAPVGYPFSKPDCFWTAPELRLQTGAMAANTNTQPIPNLGEPQVWFSWHVERWDPNRDSLLTYLRVIDERFRRVQ